MALDTYQCKPIVLPSSDLAYSFESIGPNGIIKKIIHFHPIDQIINGEAIVNLSLGDWDEIEETLNDQRVSDNGDTNKILATVALTALQYLDEHGPKKIYIKGSTPARTRLYQIAMNANRAIWEHLFLAYGLLDEFWERFTKGNNYKAFLFTRK